MTRGIDEAPLSTDERLNVLEARFERLESGVARAMENFTARSFDAGFNVVDTDLYKLMIELREAAAGDVSNVKPPAPGEGRA